MIAITHITVELNKPGWIAALMDAHKKKNTLRLKHLRKSAFSLPVSPRTAAAQQHYLKTRLSELPSMLRSPNV